MKQDHVIAGRPIADPRRARPASAIVSAVAHGLATRLRRRVVNAPVRFVLWDGSAFALGDAAPDGWYDVHVRNPRTLLRLLLDPCSEVGEAYARGDMLYEGDLLPVFEAVFRGWKASLRPPRRWAPPWLRSLGRAARQVRHHYDIGNDFYRTWLDREMVYTCAYFPHADASLEEAQLAKMEYVCRKLQLAPGESVLEAGCGWGALARYMAARHGVRVTACNVSREQIDWARRRARELGLEDRVTFIEDDYRNVRGRFDVFVSVGMLEHVGRASYRDLGRKIDEWIDGRHGRGLLHFIGRNQAGELNPWIRKRIFPGAYPPVLSEVCTDVLEPWGLSTLDVENLRPHYARTLALWRERFEAAWPDLAERHDERFLRAWRVYLVGSEVAFTTGYMQLFQVLFARAGHGSNALRTRDAWYRESLVEHAAV